MEEITMSAWLCRNGTLSLCVDVIKRDDFKEFDVENYADKSNEELIEILSELNTKSLDCRYGKSDSHILLNKRYIPFDIEDGQRFKSVSCYLYQTCECEENWDHPLYKGLDEWYLANENKFAPSWKKYEWDIDNPR